MFREVYNGLGIVQIVEVTTKMTNDPRATNQQHHLQRHSNDWVSSNGSRCLIYLHNRRMNRRAVQWAHKLPEQSRGWERVALPWKPVTVTAPGRPGRPEEQLVHGASVRTVPDPSLRPSADPEPWALLPGPNRFHSFVLSFPPTQTNSWDCSVPINQYSWLKRAGRVSVELS